MKIRPKFCTLFGQGFGTLVIRNGGTSIAVGFDGRLSSPDLESAVVEGLCEAGLHVYRIGLGPSPMLYYATHFFKADAGLMITGSHNPPEYNGIKMTLGGKSFFGDDIKKLGKLIAAGDFEKGMQGNETQGKKERRDRT